MGCMSWEYLKYEAHCANCGRKGFCIQGSDDWGRTSTSWEGFDSKPPHATAVARKRASDRDRTPVCNCGSSDIKIGDFVDDA